MAGKVWFASLPIQVGRGLVPLPARLGGSGTRRFASHVARRLGADCIVRPRQYVIDRLGCMPSTEAGPACTCTAAATAMLPLEGCGPRPIIMSFDIVLGLHRFGRRVGREHVCAREREHDGDGCTNGCGRASLVCSFIRHPLPLCPLSLFTLNPVFCFSHRRRAVSSRRGMAYWPSEAPGASRA